MKIHCRKFFAFVVLISLAACGGVEQSENNATEYTSVVITQNRDTSVSISDGTRTANISSLKTDVLPQGNQSLFPAPDSEGGGNLCCDSCICQGSTCVCYGCHACY